MCQTDVEGSTSSFVFSSLTWISGSSKRVFNERKSGKKYSLFFLVLSVGLTTRTLEAERRPPTGLSRLRKPRPKLEERETSLRTELR